jgi:HD-GYP domain-containing protein (c-di-GMP phosphodiesterase class II)
MTEEQFTAALLAGKGLLAALTERDRYTVWHQDRVGLLAEHLARQLGLSGSEVRQARATGIYHDIGKIAVPDDALFKPGPLTHAEWSAMQAHSEIGERILMASENPLLRSIAGFVRHHHEKYDGSGYPDGLSGGEIPLVAQIVSIADAYDAMASERPYRPIRRHETIVAVLAGEVWQKWDGTLFDALVRIFERDPEVARSYAITD